jgi:hypothetical protein
VGIGSAAVVVNSDRVVVGPGSTVVEVDEVDDSTAVVGTVVDGDVAGPPVLEAWTSAVSEVATTWLRFEPGHDVALMARCPVIVAVVTVEPAGHRFEPLEVKLTCDSGAVATPCLSASQARRSTSEPNAAPEGLEALKSPIRQTSWLNP